jgi:SAM-dependent methyltransferase
MSVTKSTEQLNNEIYNDTWTEQGEFWRTSSSSYRLYYALIKRCLNKIVRKSQLKSVLDIGCGDGTKTYVLSKLLPDAQILGIDFSNTGITYAESHFKSENLCFKCVNASDQKVYTEKYDLITTFECLEHLENYEDVLCKACDSSRKYVLIGVPCGTIQSKEYEIHGHLRRFKQGEIEKFMINKDFKPVEVLYAGFPWYNMVVWIMYNVSYLRNAFDKKVRNSKKNWTGVLFNKLTSFLFLYLSSRKRWGDQFVGLFEKGDGISSK